MNIEVKRSKRLYAAVTQDCIQCIRTLDPPLLMAMYLIPTPCIPLIPVLPSGLLQCQQLIQARHVCMACMELYNMHGCMHGSRFQIIPLLLALFVPYACAGNTLVLYCSCAAVYVYGFVAVGYRTLQTPSIYGIDESRTSPKRYYVYNYMAVGRSFAALRARAAHMLLQLYIQSCT